MGRRDGGVETPIFPVLALAVQLLQALVVMLPALAPVALRLTVLGMTTAAAPALAPAVVGTLAVAATIQPIAGPRPHRLQGHDPLEATGTVTQIGIGIGTHVAALRLQLSAPGTRNAMIPRTIGGMGRGVARALGVTGATMTLTAMMAAALGPCVLVPVPVLPVVAQALGATIGPLVADAATSGTGTGMLMSAGTRGPVDMDATTAAVAVACVTVTERL